MAVTGYDGPICRQHGEVDDCGPSPAARPCGCDQDESIGCVRTYGYGRCDCVKCHTCQHVYENRACVKCGSRQARQPL